MFGHIQEELNTEKQVFEGDGEMQLRYTINKVEDEHVVCITISRQIKVLHKLNTYLNMTFFGQIQNK